MRNEFVVNKNPELFLKEITADFEVMISGGMSEAEATNYVDLMLRAARPCKQDEEMHFIMFDEPSNIESDCRVAFVYEPTYMVCASIIYAVVNYDSLSDISSIKKEFQKLLKGCTGRNLIGHGYDGADGFFKAMEIFAKSNIHMFLERYGDEFSEFKDFFAEREKYLVDTFIVGEEKNPWSGESYELKAKNVYKKLYSKLDTVNVFVYGTLMRGCSAHKNYMSEAKYIGDYVLYDYAMYNLGSFPGIRPCRGEQVVGELYSMPLKCLRQMDLYEDEGNLYIRKNAVVSNIHEEKEAVVYVYNRFVDAKPVRHKWNASDEDMVWYACYGSNLDEERFTSYIQGGLCEANGRSYPGCKNKNMWVDDFYKYFGGEMYFGNSSSSWDNMGVSFYDHQCYGETLMHLYCITWDQFLDIQKQEGSSPEWYGRVVCIGTIDNDPIYTLTSEHRRPENEPSETYLNVLRKGAAKA